MTRIRRVLAWAWLHPTEAGVVVLGVGVLVTLAAGGLCRGAPTRVEERKEATAEVHQVETGQREEARELVRHVETREERRPDGSITIVRVEDEREESAATSTATATTDARAELREERIVERARPRNRLAVLPGWRPAERLQLMPAELSVEYTRRVAGPLQAGPWGRIERRDRIEWAAGVAVAWEW